MIDQSNLEQAIERAKSYHTRLIVLHGECATQCINHAAASYDLPSINLSLVLSEQLIIIPRQDRAKLVSTVIAKLIDGQEALVLLNHIEILFDRSLSIDPLKFLQNSAKNNTLVVAWPGERTTSSLTYATPSHKEFRSYKKSDYGETIFIEANENNKEAT